MRFLLFVIIAAATGAVGMTVMQTFVPTNASVRESVRALGGEWEGLRLADYNPIAAYRKVITEIRNPTNETSLKFGTTPIPSIQVTGPQFKPYGHKPDPRPQSAIAAGMGVRAAQEIRRAQDITAYGRNPTRRHGVPPR